MKVEIRSYHHDPNGTLLRTWTLDRNGRAVCDNASVQEEAELDGIVGQGRMYYPKDGEAFLRHLPCEYANSSFVRAMIVE
ncbi:hypothetical protein [Prosthecobacter sp.]|uniref:hypothetical protein n=1 Tax=Prosthecobacter sp. TaxID=1965333 RepID=UPI0037851B84